MLVLYSVSIEKIVDRRRFFDIHGAVVLSYDSVAGLMIWSINHGNQR